MRDDLKVLILLAILAALLGSILYYIKIHENNDEDFSEVNTSYYGNEYGEEYYSNETVEDASPYPESNENFTVEPIITHNSAEESEQ